MQYVCNRSVASLLVLVGSIQTGCSTQRAPESAVPPPQAARETHRRDPHPDRVSDRVAMPLADTQIGATAVAVAGGAPSDGAAQAGSPDAGAGNGSGQGSTSSTGSGAAPGAGAVTETGGGGTAGHGAHSLDAPPQPMPTPTGSDGAPPHRADAPPHAADPQGATPAPTSGASSGSPGAETSDARHEKSPTSGAPQSDGPSAKPAPAKARPGWFDDEDTGRYEIVLPTAPKELNVDLSKLNGAALPDADERRNVIGAWVQTAGGNGPDLGFGDFTEAFVVFRTDGVAEFIRFFGPNRAVRFNRQLKYTVDQGKIKFELGSEKSQAFKAVTVPSSDGKSTLKARPPSTSLPSTLEYDATSTAMRIGSRKFQRTETVKP